MSSSNLEQLISRARTVRQTAADREEQRRSFAFGNTNTENARITRKTIDDAATRLSATEGERGRQED